MIQNDPTSSDVKLELQAWYLKAALAGSGRQADEVIARALEAGLSVNEIYLEIFQFSAYTTGQLWQHNLVSVAQEHLATAIIERQMDELHPLFKPRVEKDLTLLIGAVEKEYHCVGVRMVADFFEQDGWTVHYLGAAVPTSAFLAIAREMKPDLVGLSSQMIYHLPAIVDFVSGVEKYGLAGIPIMVGGMPFIQQPELYAKLGVQFSGTNARDALEKAGRLFG